jgi:hypothetical protein
MSQKSVKEKEAVWTVEDAVSSELASPYSLFNSEIAGNEQEN